MTETLTHVGIPAQTATAVRPASAPPAAEPGGRQWEFDALRVFAILGVIAIHVSGLLFFNEDLDGTRRWWAAATVNIGLTWVVPAFVMLSGALVLAPRAHAKGPWEFYRKRFSRILPALIAWHLIYLLIVRAWLRGEPLQPRLILIGFLDAKTYTALYFLFLIAGLYVLAPVLAAFLRDGGRRRALWVAAVAIVFTQGAYTIRTVFTLLGEDRQIHLGAWTQWWPYVGIFVAGYALRRTVLSVRGLVIAFLIGCAATAEAIWQYGGPPQFRELQAMMPVTRIGPMATIGAICFFLVAVGIGARWKPGRAVTVVLRRLSDAAFGVFLVHLLVIQVLQIASPAVAEGASPLVLTVTFVATTVVSFLISLVAARIPGVRAIF